jgi:hypothetical protein
MYVYIFCICIFPPYSNAPSSIDLRQLSCEKSEPSDSPAIMEATCTALATTPVMVWLYSRIVVLVFLALLFFIRDFVFVFYF